MIYQITNETLNKFGVKEQNGKLIYPVIRTDFYPSNEATTAIDPVWIVEKRPEALLGQQAGINTQCKISNNGNWTVFNKSNLIILYPRNDNGTTWKDKVITEIRQAECIPESLKVIGLPYGTSLIGYFKSGGSVQELHRLLNKVQSLVVTKLRPQICISLNKVSDPIYINKEITTTVLVNGVARSPILVPAKIKYNCKADIKCEGCPCISSAQETIISPSDSRILNWLKYKTIEGGLQVELGMYKKCGIAAEVTEWQALCPISMIPALSIQESGNEYVNRRGYFSGYSIQPNMNYKIKAIPCVHPWSKESVLLVTKTEGFHDSLDDFKLTNEEIEQIRDMVGNDSPGKTITSISDFLSKEVTKIYGRPELHLAADICFHSISQFNFSGYSVRRGSLDLILFGDTRCGKGQVAESLSKFYDLGCCVSGENATFMGLVGGVQKLDSNFELYWGRIPTNNGRLVIVDEFSGFEGFGRLSRIRSEGIAEIDKGGVTAQTEANTRLIWISNPKHGREVSYFGTGIESLNDLVGAAEDIARFDLAVIVVKGEVDYHEINRQTHDKPKKYYDREKLRKLVLWCWSRKSTDIEFSKEAEHRIMELSNMLAEKYSPSIPLIQGENVRIKLAKISVAIAGRVFSTSDGTNLIVEVSHVNTAHKLIQLLYDKPAAGYNSYSELEANSKVIKELGKLEAWLGAINPDNRQVVIDGMLSMGQFGLRDLQDWTGLTADLAKRQIGLLVRCCAIKKAYGHQDTYRKIPAFVEFLKKEKKKFR